MKNEVKIFIGLLVLAIIAILVYFLLHKKRDDGKDNSEKLEELTKELFQMVLRLNSMKCKTPEIADIVQKGKTIDDQAISIISNKSDLPTPSSINRYNQIHSEFLKALDNVSNLPECSTYCSQGLYNSNTNTCVCPNAFPVPIEYNNNIYCAKEDCSTIPHTSFLPGATADKNECKCVDGYINDTENPNVYCYNESKTKELDGYYQQLSGFINDINNLKPFNVVGTYNNFTINPQTDLQTPSLLQKVDNVYSTIDCANNCSANQNCKSFAFDGNEQSCYLYSNTQPTVSSPTRTFGFRS